MTTHIVGSVRVVEVDDFTFTVDSRGKTKTFKGETAWSDAQRYANDLVTKYHGPFFGQFIL